MTDDPATTEKTYRAIGRFMFEFSRTEHLIRVCLHNAIGLPDKHYVAVQSGFDVASMCNVAKMVHSDKVGAEVIEKHLNRFLEINHRHRVPLAHGYWTSAMGGSVAHISRNKLEGRRLTQQSEELERLADELADMRQYLEEIALRRPDAGPLKVIASPFNVEHMIATVPR